MEIVYYNVLEQIQNAVATGVVDRIILTPEEYETLDSDLKPDEQRVLRHRSEYYGVRIEVRP
jgi:hypothetical protein